MTYQESVKAAKAEAALWLEAHDIPEIEEKSYAERKGYEIQTEADAEVADIIAQIAADESQHSAFWNFEDTSELSVIEAGGIFNVTTLGHWKKRRETSQYVSSPEVMTAEHGFQTYRDSTGPKSGTQTDYVFEYVGRGHVITGGDTTGSRFNPIGFLRHEKAAKKAKARFGLSDFYHANGKARTMLISEGGKRIVKAQAIASVLKKAERQSPAVKRRALILAKSDARKALAEKAARKAAYAKTL